jgi:hypothetical protein
MHFNFTWAGGEQCADEQWQSPIVHPPENFIRHTLMSYAGRRQVSPPTQQQQLLQFYRFINQTLPANRLYFSLCVMLIANHKIDLPTLFSLRLMDTSHKQDYLRSLCPRPVQCTANAFKLDMCAPRSPSPPSSSLSRLSLPSAPRLNPIISDVTIIVFAPRIDI